MPVFKSFIYNKKRVSPSTDPWGTPEVTTLGEEKEPSTTTCGEWLLKNDLIHDSNLPLITICL